MRRFLLVLQFMVLSIQIGWTTENEAFDFNKVAAIKIVPYYPDLYVHSSEEKEQLKLQTGSGSLKLPPSYFGRKYTNAKGEPNEFNIGKTFRYLTTKEEYLNADFDNEVPLYMEQLINYHKDFNEKNVLLVQMRVTATPSVSLEGVDDRPLPTVYKYLFGVFVSGG